jgi:hypothetical protein
VLDTILSHEQSFKEVEDSKTTSDHITPFPRYPYQGKGCDEMFVLWSRFLVLMVQRLGRWRSTASSKSIEYTLKLATKSKGLMMGYTWVVVQQPAYHSVVQEHEHRYLHGRPQTAP